MIKQHVAHVKGSYSSQVERAIEVEITTSSAEDKERKVVGTTLYNIASIVSIVLALATLFGGIFAFRSGFVHTANQVQERVINALQSEIDAIRARMDDLERENTRLRHTIETICMALKTRGIVV
ncbi:MAG: hypothetical protein JO202_00270, partial [Ktedonobacteraceae bacterium]|nr:hypothetical protein [Ktedonobacteraceae bacterium]